jgi:outer membrane protein
VSPKPQPPAALTPAKGSEPSASKPATRIGHVDLARVRTDSDPGKAGQALLTDKKKKLQTQIEAKRKQLDKLRASIEAKLSTYSPLQKEVRAKEFQKKVEEYQGFLQSADNELQELQQEQSRLLYEKIGQASAEYGKANGLSAVVVKGDLLYQADGVDVLDITTGIVKLVNEQANKK